MALSKTYVTAKSGSGTYTITSPSISLAANSAVFVLVTANTPTADTLTMPTPSNTGTGLSWSKIKEENTRQGTSAAIFRAWNASAQSVTVTENCTTEHYSPVSIVVVAYEGSQETFTGATNSSNSSSGTPTCDLTTTVDGSDILAVVSDWANAGTGTAGSGETMLYTTSDSDYSQHNLNETSPVTSAGTVTVSLSAPSGENYNMAVVEVIDAGAPLPPGINYQTPGAVAYTTGNATPAYPAGIASGDLLILVVGTKPETSTMSTPAGWTSLGAFNGTTGTTGIDTGPMRVEVYSKIADGTESGTLTVTNDGNNSVSAAQIFRYTKNSTADFGLAIAFGEDTTGGTGWSATCSSASIAIADGDEILFGGIIPTDVSTPSQFSAEAVALSGVTFGTAAEIVEWDTSSGQDMGGFIARTSATAGSGTGNPVVTATAGGTTTNVYGPSFVLRIRDTGSVSGDATVSGRATVAAVGAVPAAGISAGLTIGATVAALAATPAPVPFVRVANRSTVAAVVAVPTVTRLSTGLTATAVAATSTVPAPTPRVVAPAAVVAGVAAVPTVALSAGLTAPMVAAIASVPTVGVSAGLTVPTVTSISAIDTVTVITVSTEDAQVVGRATVAAIADVPTSGLSAGLTAATVAVTATVPTAGLSTGPIPTTVATTATVPTLGLSTGLTAAVVGAVAAVPTVAISVGISVSTVTASTSVPDPSVSVTTGEVIYDSTVVTYDSTEYVYDGGAPMPTPAVVAATVGIPAVGLSAGLVVSAVPTAVAVPSVTGIVLVAASVVAATSTVPSPTPAVRSLPAVVVAVAAVPGPLGVSVGLLVAVVAGATGLPPPAGLSAGTAGTTVAAVAAVPFPAEITATTPDAMVGVDVVTATAAVPVPTGLSAGLTLAADVVPAVAAIPAPGLSAGLTVDVVPTIAGVPAVALSTGLTAGVVLTVAEIPAVASIGAGVSLAAVTATVGVPTPTVATGEAVETIYDSTGITYDSAAYTYNGQSAGDATPAATVVAATTTIPAPGVSTGTPTPAVVTAVASVPAPTVFVRATPAAVAATSGIGTPSISTGAPPSGPPVITPRWSDNSTTSAQTRNLGPFTPTADSVLFLVVQVESNNHSTNPTLTTAMITGTGGLTWSLLGTTGVIGSDALWDGGISVFAARVGPNPTAMTLTIDPNPTGTATYFYGALVFDITNVSTSLRQTAAVNSGTWAGSNTASLSATLGSAPVLGDLLIGIFGAQNDSTGAFAAIPGWTVLYNQTGGYNHNAVWSLTDSTTTVVSNSDLGQAVWWGGAFLLDLVPSAPPATDATVTGRPTVLSTAAVPSPTVRVAVPVAVVSAVVAVLSITGSVQSRPQVVVATASVPTPAPRVVAPVAVVPAVAAVPSVGVAVRATPTTVAATVAVPSPLFLLTRAAVDSATLVESTAIIQGHADADSFALAETGGSSALATGVDVATTDDGSTSLTTITYSTHDGMDFALLGEDALVEVVTSDAETLTTWAETGAVVDVTIVVEVVDDEGLWDNGFEFPSATDSATLTDVGQAPNIPVAGEDLAAATLTEATALQIGTMSGVTGTEQANLLQDVDIAATSVSADLAYAFTETGYDLTRGSDVTDTATLGEDFALAVEVDATETPSLAEDATSVGSAEVIDAAALTESADAGPKVFKDSGDSATLTEDVAAVVLTADDDSASAAEDTALDLGHLGFDSMTIAEQVARGVDFTVVEVISETVDLVDVLQIISTPVEGSDGATLAESGSVFVSIPISDTDTATLTEGAVDLAYEYPVVDLASLAESVAIEVLLTAADTGILSVTTNVFGPETKPYTRNGRAVLIPSPGMAPILTATGGRVGVETVGNQARVVSGPGKAQVQSVPSSYTRADEP